MNNHTENFITRDSVFKALVISSVLTPYIGIILAIVRAPWFNI